MEAIPTGQSMDCRWRLDKSRGQVLTERVINLKNLFYLRITPRSDKKCLKLDFPIFSPILKIDNFIATIAGSYGCRNGSL